MATKTKKNIDHKSPTVINLAVHVKNFGPISDANITIKPLTILVGPNSSGKSYAAMLAHSLISSHSMMSLLRARSHRSEFFTLPYQKIETILSRTKLELGKEKDITMPVQTINKIKDTYTKILFDEVLTEELHYNFAAKLDDITRFGEKEFTINVNNAEGINIVRCGNNSQVKSTPNLKNTVTIQHVKTAQKTYFEAELNKSGNLIFRIGDTESKEIRRRFLHPMLSFIDRQIGRTIPRYSYYLPAARSGTLHGFKTIITGMMRNAARSVTRGVEVPPIPGTIVEFMSEMAEIPIEREGEGLFASLGKELENDLHGGRIILSSSETGMPEIEYECAGHRIPLYRTSSSISESAPLTLFLRYIVRKRDLLIIEEPEAHLHPSNQLILARYIARMIRAGLNIMITTHSITILEQLSLCLQAGRFDNNSRTKMNLNDDEYLMENEVSPYLFTGSPTDGYKACQIKFSAKDGIDQDEFLKIEDVLNNQTSCIDQYMQEQK